MIKLFFKSLRLSQARPLSPIERIMVKQDGITVLSLFRTKKELQDFIKNSPQISNIGTKKNPKYRLLPPKKGFMASVRGAANGLDPSFMMFIGKKVGLDVFKINLDILSNKKIPKEVFMLHLTGDQITDEILDKLSLKGTDGILYSSEVIDFNEIAKISKRDLFKHKNSLKIVKGYSKWIARMTVGLTLLGANFLLPDPDQKLKDELKDSVKDYAKDAIDELFSSTDSTPNSSGSTSESFNDNNKV